MSWLFGPSRQERTLDRILHMLHNINWRTLDMAGELDGVKAAVARNTSVIASAMDLIRGIKAKLDDAIANSDPAALEALSAELGAQDDALAEAVAANTPA